MYKDFRPLILICISILLFEAFSANFFSDHAENENVIDDIAPDTSQEPRQESTRVTRGENDTWSMHGYDMKNSFNYPSAAPDEGDVIWDKPFPADFAAAPSIIDGTIYVGGTDFKLYCIDANTGDTIYTKIFPSQIVSSPYIDGDMLYFGCRDKKLYAFNRETRETEWSFPTGGDVDSSPKVLDEAVYFGSLDGCFYAVDTVTQALKWEYDCGNGYSVKSSPAISDDNVVFGCYKVGESSGKVVCLDIDGFSDGNDGFTGEINTSGSAGDVLWEYPTLDGIRGSASVMNGKVFMGSDDGKLHCISLDDGSLEWDMGTGDSITGCPATVPETNSVVFGSRDGYIYHLNATTGTQIWKTQAASYVNSPATVADGRVYVGDLDYHLYCYDLAGFGNLTTEKIFDIDVGDHMWCMAPPVIHNGVLYQVCDNGDEVNSGKIIAVGTPDVKIYDIKFDDPIKDGDPSPYEGEMVGIEVVLKNNGTIGCDMDLELYRATPNNAIKVLIEKRHISTLPLSQTSITVDWKAEPGSWFIWAKINNTTPEDGTQTYHANYKDITVSSLADDEWNFYMKDTVHTSYGEVAIDTNRIEWEASPGGKLFPPVLSKGFLVASNAEGSVFAYDQYSQFDGDEQWHKDFAEEALSSPSILGDRVFVPFEGFKLRCLDLMHSGKVLWTFENDQIQDPVLPLMAKHGLVFLPTESGMIYAIDDDDGEIVWTRDLGDTIATVPISFEDDLMIVDQNGQIHIMDVYEGNIRGRKDLGSTNPMTPTCYDGKIIVAFENGNITAYDATANASTPMLELDDTLTTGLVKISAEGHKALGTDSGLRMIDETNTPYGLVTTGGDIPNPIAGGPQRCYFIDSTGGLYAINTSENTPTGERILWNMSLGPGTNGTPVPWEGKVYVSTAGGKIYCLGAPNRAPVGILDSPTSGMTFYEIDEIEFSAVSSSDPDRDELRYRWTSSLDGELYDGFASSFKTNLTSGLHEITLTVDDQRGGKDHKTITISILGKRTLESSFSLYDLDVRMSVMGEGELRTKLESDIPGYDNSTNWKVITVSSDHHWVGWMELKFALFQGGYMFPQNVDLSSLRLYYLDAGTLNWTEFDELDLSISGGYAVVNLTGIKEVTVTFFGKIEEVIGDRIKPVAKAGKDQTVNEGSFIFFDASESYDDQGISNYAWIILKEGEGEVPYTYYEMETGFNFIEPGEYTVTLNVTDTSGNWAIDKLNITVTKIETPEKAGSNKWVWRVILIIAVLLIGILIVREMRNRKEQDKMDAKFFQEENGWKRQKGRKVDDGEVDKYVDMFTVAEKPDEKKKGSNIKSPLPDTTVGGKKVRKIGEGKKE